MRFLMYLTPVKNLMLWFADNKGLATGIAVAGFGLAKAIASPLMEYLIGTVGLVSMFFILAAVYAVMMFVGFLLIKRPAGWVYDPATSNGTLWLIVTMLFLINAGYGGGFSTLPVLLEQHFGMKSVSTVHGLALSAWAFAGLSGNQLASFVVSHTTDAAHRYSTLIPIITVLYAVALISIIAVTLATKGKSANALSSR